MEVRALVPALSISTLEYMKRDFATDQHGVKWISYSILFKGNRRSTQLLFLDTEQQVVPDIDLK